MSSRRHPTDADLRRWLDDDDPDVAVDEHLATCEQCAAQLEALDSSLGPVATALELITRPPDDLRTRLEERFAEAALQQATKSLIGDLFGVGFRTLRVLAEPPDPVRSSPDPSPPEPEERPMPDRHEDEETDR